MSDIKILEFSCSADDSDLDEWLLMTEFLAPEMHPAHFFGQGGDGLKIKKGEKMEIFQVEKDGEKVFFVTDAGGKLFFSSWKDAKAFLKWLKRREAAAARRDDAQEMAYKLACRQAEARFEKEEKEKGISRALLIAFYIYLISNPPQIKKKKAPGPGC